MKEALKLALEALENWLEFDPENFGGVDNKAITAIKEALAQPEQEPVGEVVVESMGMRGSDAMQVRMHFYKEIPPVGAKIYTSPPQRTWVGLTDEEVIEISHLALTRVKAVQMTTAKLKEKNT